MINAKSELIRHLLGKPEVKYVQIISHIDWVNTRIEGTLDEVLPKLDFVYDESYGGQELFGTVWYVDGTWSERREYDGSEWWEYRKCPPCPLDKK